MKNRAKCKLCKSVIESFHSTDYVSCKCGEISLDAGDALKCYAKDFNNFMRVDDEGNEIIVKVTESQKEEKTYSSKPTKKNLLDMLDEMINNIDRLPQHALTSPITHYDFYAALLLLSSLFKTDGD